MDKEATISILNKKWTKQELEQENWGRVSDIRLAKLFSHFEYSKALVIDYLDKILKRGRSPATLGVNKFIKNCKDCGIDIEHFARLKTEKNKLNKTNTIKKDGIQKAFEKMSPILDLFNINKRTTLDTIRDLANNPILSHETILKSYKELYILLMAKAKGETVTKSVNATYIISLDNNGDTVKELAKNDKGEQRIYETTQSYLPDERAFAGALLVLEVIERLENGNRVYATDDELEEEYSNLLADVIRQRETYGNKEYTQEEIEAIDAVIEE